MQSIVPLHGFGGVPYSAVRKAAPKNLLDNSDFTNLVAQAGIGGNHGTTAYAADRWILDSGTVSYEAGVGLTLNGTIRQKLEFPPTGDTSTFVGMASGEASISYADGAVTITSSGGVLKWAALYAGVYTDATMPDYHPKGYGAELAECQRYYVWFDRYLSNGLLTSSATNYYMPISLPVAMRCQPTATSSGWIGRISTGYSKHTGSTKKAFNSLWISDFNGCRLSVCDSISTATDANNINVSFMVYDLEFCADIL